MDYDLFNQGWITEALNLGWLEEQERVDPRDHIFDIIAGSTRRAWNVDDEEYPHLTGQVLWQEDLADLSGIEYIGPEELREQAHEWLYRRALNLEEDSE